MNCKDDEFMAVALKLATNGRFTSDPNPHVGCVIVKKGIVIAEGWTQRVGDAHAEIHALSKTTDAKGSDVYVTLEPCSHYGRTGPCCEALILAGINKVVIAMLDPNPLVAGKGVQKLRDAGIDVIVGVLHAEAEHLNRGFFKRMLHGLPWIYSKIACSLDGRTALASGQSKWITSIEARQDVHLFRAQCSAILTGIDTVLADDPELNARVNFELLQPVKVVLDSTLRFPSQAKLLSNSAETWIITCCDDQYKQQVLTDLGCKVFYVASNNIGQVDLLAAFQLLAEQEINSVWIEAGARLNGSLLCSNLVDEWIIYMAACVIGDAGRGLFHLPVLESMADVKQLSLLSTTHIGSDLRLTFNRKIA